MAMLLAECVYKAFGHKKHTIWLANYIATSLDTLKLICRLGG
jgi:hypothetical protein